MEYKMKPLSWIANKNKPFFSIVIPTHGRLSLLKESLDSIKKTNEKDFEIIISDDTHSKKERKTIIKWAQELYKALNVNITYIFTESNLGQSKNTNQGLFHAQGDWIRILHSDDILHPNIFKTEKNIIEENNDVSIIYHSVIQFTNPNEIKYDLVLSPTYNKEDAYHIIVYGLHSFCALPSSLLFRKEFLEITGGFNDKMKRACDWEFYSKLIMHSFNVNKKIVQFKPGMMYYRKHGLSNTNKIQTILSNYIEYKIISHSIINFLKQNPQHFGFLEVNLYKSCAFSYRTSRLVKDFKSLNLLLKLIFFRKFLNLIFESEDEKLEFLD